MISWLWIPVAVILGGCFGCIVTSVCAYDNVQRAKRKRWWEHEQREDS